MTSCWLAPIKISNNEKIIFTCYANRTQYKGRSVGGKLFITNEHLLFSPHLFDFILGGKKIKIPISEINSIKKEEKGGDIFGGGLRGRLKFNLKNEKTELFVVNKLDKIIEKLNLLIFANKRKN